MKKFAFAIMILFAVVMSLPVSAAETRRLADESDEISALADDIVSAVNSVIDAENSEHRYTKKTLPHVTREDIAGLTMYRLHILPDTVFTAGMAPDRLENVLEENEYEWILQVDIEDVNVTVHLSRYSGADPEHLAKLVEENVITDEQAEEFTKKQGQWHVYSLALSDTYNPAFDGTYRTAVLTADDTSEYMTVARFAEKYGTADLLSGEGGNLIGALPGNTETVSRYIPAMLITAAVLALGAVLLINRWVSARRVDSGNQV